MRHLAVSFVYGHVPSSPLIPPCLFVQDAVEAIVGIIALTNNELRIVQTSMLGSILSNLLLVLGCSFLAAGWKFKESNFQITAAQASSSLLTLAGIVCVLPSLPICWWRLADRVYHTERRS
jgi:calcium/proton exchanger cax